MGKDRQCLLSVYQAVFLVIAGICGFLVVLVGLHYLLMNSLIYDGADIPEDRSCY